MPAVRDIIICVLVVVVLVLGTYAHQVRQDKQLLCSNLKVPTSVVRERPDDVNRLLEACGFGNVHVGSSQDSVQ